MYNLQFVHAVHTNNCNTPVYKKYKHISNQEISNDSKACILK